MSKQDNNYDYMTYQNKYYIHTNDEDQFFII